MTYRFSEDPGDELGDICEEMMADQDPKKLAWRTVFKSINTVQ